MLVCGLAQADIFYTAWHGGFKNIPYLCHFSVVLMGSRSLRAIGRILGVSNVSVLRWIRGFGEQVMTLKKEQTQVEVMELDELHSYVKSKKTPVGYGLLLIDIKKDLSMLCWDVGASKQGKNSGTMSSTER